MKLKLLDNQEQAFKICLIGEGVIPRIKMIIPAIRHHRICVLHFPVTCLGSTSKKIICFKNVNSVMSTVKVNIMQLPYEERPVFWLETAEECAHTIATAIKGKEKSI